MRRELLSIPSTVFRFLERLPKPRVVWWPRARDKITCLAKVRALYALRTSFTSSTSSLRYRRYGRRRRLYSLRRLRGGGVHTLSGSSATDARSISSSRVGGCQSRWRREQTQRSSPRAAEAPSLLEAPAMNFQKVNVLVSFGRWPLEMGRSHHTGRSSCVSTLASETRSNRHSARKDGIQHCGQPSVGRRSRQRA